MVVTVTMMPKVIMPMGSDDDHDGGDSDGEGDATKTLKLALNSEYQF